MTNAALYRDAATEIFMSKNDTLHGGREVPVKIFGAEPGKILEEKFFVRQFRVKEYPALRPLYLDEIALVAKACDKAVDVIGNVLPESYEELQKATREVNERGFFTYMVRQLQVALEDMQSIPPELLQLQLQKSALPTPSRTLPQPRV